MKQATLGAFKLRDNTDDDITTGSLFAKRNKEPEKPAPLTGTKVSDDSRTWLYHFSCPLT